jgi:hypothetical protein
MLHIPPSPLPLRAINRIGGAISATGLGRAGLEPDELIAAAQKQAGLTDFGEGPYRGALQTLCAALESEANLSFIGRHLVRQQLLNGLKLQLQLQDWFRRHPEIADEKIEQPLVIIGMPRTGTTILHELLTLDPANRNPLFWEVAYPFPPPESATYTTDPRIARQQRELDFSHYIMPGVQGMHRMGSQLPQECVAVTAYVFTSMLYSTIFRIPSYTRWLEHGADHAAAFRFHRRFHQLLQWRCKAKRWVVKSPGHLWTLPALLNEYPDARLIQTHRDPLKILSSLTSLSAVLRQAYATRIDTAEFAREWSDTCAFALNASLAARKSGAVNPERIIDLQFSDLMRNPAAYVQSIYERFALPFPPQMAKAIGDYIAANPSDKHGGHKHSFADTGLDLAAERARVRDYQEYFGVASDV